MCLCVENRGYCVDCSNQIADWTVHQGCPSSPHPGHYCERISLVAIVQCILPEWYCLYCDSPFAIRNATLRLSRVCQEYSDSYLDVVHIYLAAGIDLDDISTLWCAGTDSGSMF